MKLRRRSANLPANLPVHLRATLLAATLAATLTPTARAADLTLTFDGGVGVPSTDCTNAQSGVGAPALCVDGSQILQSYGDIPGLLDITYLAPRQGAIGSLSWWGFNYNSLYGVLWATGTDGNSEARIDFRPLQAGAVVTLSSFDLGAYPNTVRGTSVSVVELDTGITLFSLQTNVGTLSTGGSPTTFVPAVSSAKGLRLVWQDSAYNVGVDNIRLSVSAVPEADALGMACAGLLTLGWLSASASAASRRRAAA